ncbi:MAG: hypothetical protein KY476_09520 [Planctomycetes bacterium]|nr:hypothetical protein [Planctomycetota bacterium]
MSELHAIREQIVAEYGGDLMKLTRAAQECQKASGRRIIRRGELASSKKATTASGRARTAD